MSAAASNAVVNPWPIAILVALASFMEVLDTTIANVALPYIAGGMGVSEDEASWVVTTYLVSNAIILTASSFLARMLGRKNLLSDLSRTVHAELGAMRVCPESERGAAVSAGWLGTIVFALVLALVAWAISTMTRAGSNVPTRLPTTSIVETGPYRFMRNPIYLGMVLGLIDFAIAFNSLWLLVRLAPFALVIRDGVIAREEAYLERKFGEVYLAYKSRVRRWL